MAHITVLDIAREANVSPSTAARAINNSSYVSEDKRRAIDDAVKKLGYIPNQVAKGLRNNRTNIIGYILTADFNPFFRMIGEALDAACGKNGYRLLNVSTPNDPKKLDDMVRELVGHMVEGIIFSGMTGVSVDIVEEVRKMGVPVVMIERPHNLSGIDKIYIDNEEGSCLATGYIRSMGHKQIAFIGAEPKQQIEKQRYEGFVKTMDRYGITLEPDYVVFCENYSVESGYKAVKKLLSNCRVRPTCIYVASDVLACGSMQYLYEMDMRIPDDISIVGYDNTLTEVLSPPISTVGLPFSDIGEAAIEMIIERREKKRTTSKSLTLSPNLVIRNSVKKL